MNEIINKENLKIEDMIYEIRGKQVMLDSDLAKLYKCKNGTKEINQAVKRHVERFPKDFYYQLTQKEFSNLKSQIVTSSSTNHGGVRKMPCVFTEQGVAMLATVLKTNIASKVSVDIMRAFVSMRQYISSSLFEQKYINNLVLEDHELIKENKNNIKLLQESFDILSKKRKETGIFYNGQMYDAFSLIVDIFNSAKRKLIIVDSYADKTILDIIKRLNIKVIIITKSNSLLSKQDIEIYKKQYNNLSVIFNNTFHDRFFIIDDNITYYCGASINKIGAKTFFIDEVRVEETNEFFIERVNKLLL